jgi:uncharacterized membrane protein YagU involved in acid resistance
MTTATAAPRTGLAPLRTIALAGFAGGLVDFIYACGVGLIRSGSALKPWQGVASGWIGKQAGQMGVGSAALGVFTHFGIAFVMALAYALVASRRPALLARPLAGGVIYGLILYGVMYGMVLPLRFGRPWHWAGLLSVGDIASHIGVGLAIAFVLSRSAKQA